jgi:hypothetical protein
LNGDDSEKLSRFLRLQSVASFAGAPLKRAGVRIKRYCRLCMLDIEPGQWYLERSDTLCAHNSCAKAPVNEQK